MPPPRAILDLLRTLRRHPTDPVRLDALAARSGWSPFHLHRAFRAIVGETPKRYTLRLRLERAAARASAPARVQRDAGRASDGRAAHGAQSDDRGDHPDPKDWRTEIYWPIRG